MSNEKDFIIYNRILFKYIGSDQHVVIPDTVETIGKSAFSGCRELESVAIGDSVSRIDDQAFRYCFNLKNVHIGSGVSTIGELAFSDTGITHITIPDNVRNIGMYAFSGCRELKTVHLPEHVSLEMPSPFAYSESLKNIYFGDKIIDIKSYDDLNNILDKINALKYQDFIITHHTLEEYWGSDKVVEIPQAVSIIGDHSFANTDVSVVIIPYSVKYVDSSAFEDCEHLTQIIAPYYFHDYLQKTNPDVEILSEPATYKLSQLIENSQAFVVNDRLVGVSDNVYGYVVIDEPINGIEPGTLKNSNVISVHADRSLEDAVENEGKIFIKINEKDLDKDVSKNNSNDFTMD